MQDQGNARFQWRESTQDGRCELSLWAPCCLGLDVSRPLGRWLTGREQGVSSQRLTAPGHSGREHHRDTQ